MAINPVRFNSDGTIDVWHDEKAHGGRIALGDVPFVRHHDGELDVRFVDLICPAPGCGGSTVHPVSGGSSPEMVQRLFARLYRASKAVPAAKDWSTALAEVASAVEAMDGPERVKVTEATEEERTQEDIAAKALAEGAG